MHVEVALDQRDVGARSVAGLRRPAGAGIGLKRRGGDPSRVEVLEPAHADVFTLMTSPSRIGTTVETTRGSVAASRL